MSTPPPNQILHTAQASSSPTTSPFPSQALSLLSVVVVAATNQSACTTSPSMTSPPPKTLSATPALSSESQFAHLHREPADPIGPALLTESPQIRSPVITQAPLGPLTKPYKVTTTATTTITNIITSDTLSHSQNHHTSDISSLSSHPQHKPDPSILARGPYRIVNVPGTTTIFIVRPSKPRPSSIKPTPEALRRLHLYHDFQKSHTHYLHLRTVTDLLPLISVRTSRFRKRLYTSKGINWAGILARGPPIRHYLHSKRQSATQSSTLLESGDLVPAAAAASDTCAQSRPCGPQQRNPTVSVTSTTSLESIRPVRPTESCLSYFPLVPPKPSFSAVSSKASMSSTMSLPPASQHLQRQPNAVGRSQRLPQKNTASPTAASSSIGGRNASITSAGSTPKIRKARKKPAASLHNNKKAKVVKNSPNGVNERKDIRPVQTRKLIRREDPLKTDTPQFKRLFDRAERAMDIMKRDEATRAPRPEVTTEAMRKIVRTPLSCLLSPEPVKEKVQKSLPIKTGPVDAKKAAATSSEQDQAEILSSTAQNQSYDPSKAIFSLNEPDQNVTRQYIWPKNAPWGIPSNSQRPENPGVVSTVAVDSSPLQPSQSPMKSCDNAPWLTSNYPSEPFHLENEPIVSHQSVRAAGDLHTSPRGSSFPSSSFSFSQPIVPSSTPAASRSQDQQQMQAPNQSPGQSASRPSRMVQMNISKQQVSVPPNSQRRTSGFNPFQLSAPGAFWNSIVVRNPTGQESGVQVFERTANTIAGISGNNYLCRSAKACTSHSEDITMTRPRHDPISLSDAFVENPASRHSHDSNSPTSPSLPSSSEPLSAASDCPKEPVMSVSDSSFHQRCPSHDALASRQQLSVYPRPHTATSRADVHISPSTSSPPLSSQSRQQHIQQMQFQPQIPHRSVSSFSTMPAQGATATCNTSSILRTQQHGTQLASSHSMMPSYPFLLVPFFPFPALPSGPTATSAATADAYRNGTGATACAGLLDIPHEADRNSAAGPSLLLDSQLSMSESEMARTMHQTGANTLPTNFWIPTSTGQSTMFSSSSRSLSSNSVLSDAYTLSIREDDVAQTGPMVSSKTPIYMSCSAFDPQSNATLDAQISGGGIGAGAFETRDASWAETTTDSMGMSIQEAQCYLMMAEMGESFNGVGSSMAEIVSSIMEE